MVENVVAGILIVMSVFAGAWVWWYEKHGPEEESRPEENGSEEK